MPIENVLLFGKYNRKLLISYQRSYQIQSESLHSSYQCSIGFCRGELDGDLVCSESTLEAPESLQSNEAKKHTQWLLFS